VRIAALIPLFAAVATLSVPASPESPDALFCSLQDPPQDPPKQQDPPKDEKKEETLELEITVGNRPAGGGGGGLVPQPRFKLKEALALEGKVAETEALRAAFEKPIKYLLDTQLEDGTWKFDAKKQIREEVPQNERYFQMTAADSMNKVVLTSLCCMALRAHEALSPERIRAAVARGLAFVIENAPKHTKKTYGVWTWSFAIEFLVAEFKRAKSDELKERITTSLRGTVEALLMNQRAGQAKPPPKISAAKDDGPKKEEKKETDKGYFGVTPGPEDPEQPGIPIQQVQNGGPASKGGIKAGDRILEINGVAIRGMEHLYEAVADLAPGEIARVKILRGAPKTPGRRSGGLVRDDGGWSYYTWSESAGNCTATAIVALLDAKEVGIEVPGGSLDRAVGYLSAMKMVREGSDEEGYRYTMNDRAQALDVRATIGRMAACTLALHRAGKADIDELEKSLDVFVKRRGELDKVLGFPGNHVANSFFNSPYYYFWAHYYGARAIRLVRDPKRRAEMAAQVQEAILKGQRKDGTWTDHEAWGRVYGTAMAMMALGETRHLVAGAYAKPIDALIERREF